ncbi:hypothetical protein [Nannocystis pusilla]|uniref:hypothetical protein n=1 Tax=Nannocystis pusilla TaxID=889268 RepID=UPI003B81C159
MQRHLATLLQLGLVAALGGCNSGAANSGTLTDSGASTDGASDGTTQGSVSTTDAGSSTTESATASETATITAGTTSTGEDPTTAGTTSTGEDPTTEGTTSTGESTTTEGSTTSAVSDSEGTTTEASTTTGDDTTAGTTDGGTTGDLPEFVAECDDDPANPVIVTVSPNVSARFPTITSGLAAASDGSVIEVCPGTYSDKIEVTVSITLRGAGADKTIIDGGGSTSTSTPAARWSKASASPVATPRSRTAGTSPRAARSP